MEFTQLSLMNRSVWYPLKLSILLYSTSKVSLILSFHPFLSNGSESTIFNIDKNETFRANKYNYMGAILTKPKWYRINIRIQEHSIVHIHAKQGEGEGWWWCWCYDTALSLLVTGNDITTVLMFCRYLVRTAPTTNNIILTSLSCFLTSLTIL